MKPNLNIRGFHLDLDILLPTLCLLILGIIMVTSSSISLADRDFGEPFYYLYRQMSAIFIGLGLGVILLLIPTDYWFKLNWLFLILAFALLVSVFIPSIGYTANGSTRWISLGPLRMQPSEPARLCLMIYLSGYIVRHQVLLRESFSGFIRPLFLIALASILLLAEPDFGATVVLMTTSLGLLFIGGARIRDFLFSFMIVASSLLLAAFSEPYRLKRLTGFIDPWSDPDRSGYQLIQSLIAIGSGDFYGVGLGSSVQKLFYLPEAHTDFIFAVLSEELGLIGVTITIILFGILIYKAIMNSNKAIEKGMLFQALLSSGIGIALGIQVFINIGVNVGLLPTKGLTLPLFSYGRVSIIVTLASLALLMRIQHEINKSSKYHKRTGIKR